MKVLAIQSSPNLNGLTSSLAQSVLKGVRDEGGETELIHLNKLNLKPCIACDNGWGKCGDEGGCILEDDFQNLTDKIGKCDALVFATPVYWHDLSEFAKIFLDRLRRCETSVGFKTFTGKKVIGIASAGGSGRGAVRALYNLEDYLRRLGFDIFDLVPVTRFSKDHKFEMLEKAGRRLIRG
ncbi:MAG: flavodoxin family protein [Candidatus Bathyarchaeota archaeon]|nr:flavodoxin family protein [Candidatus Bathyarchaeota archaeon]MDH5494284.1 flavodoxin family protein [Candidatus Bathyarchaeota archaeon]